MGKLGLHKAEASGRGTSRDAPGKVVQGQVRQDPRAGVFLSGGRVESYGREGCRAGVTARAESRRATWGLSH